MKAPDPHDDVRERVASIRARLEEVSKLPLDELYQVRDDLALSRVLRDVLLERVEQDDSPPFRKTALGLYAQVCATTVSDPALAASLLRDLGAHLENGVASDSSIDRLLRQTHALIRDCISLESLRIQAERRVSVVELERFAGAIVRALRAELPAAEAARVLERLDRDAFRGRLQLGTGPREIDADADADTPPSP